MFGSTVLDVLIGLIVVFLTVALAVTAGTELISTWLNMRPAQLRKALIGMLDGASGKKPVIPESHWFLDQPLIRSTADWGKRFPSYIDRSTFSEALLLAIDKDYAAKTPEELADSLIASLNELRIAPDRKMLIEHFLQEAKGDVQKFRALTEQWFDRVMDRATGWYKRNTTNVTIVLSGLIVSVANVDAVAIMQALHGSNDLRSKSTEIAAILVKNGQENPQTDPGHTKAGAANTQTAAGPAPRATQPAPVDQETIDRQIAALQSAGLPLGWHDPYPQTFAQWATKIIGLLITICAASLGAPFWFDMLTKIVNIRGAGPKPPTKTPVVSPPGEKTGH